MAPSTTPLTPDGILKLSRLTGKFHQTDVVVNVSIPEQDGMGCMWTMAYPMDPQIGRLDATVSDGVYKATVILYVTDRRKLEALGQCVVIRVREAMCCILLHGQP